MTEPGPPQDPFAPPPPGAVPTPSPPSSPSPPPVWGPPPPGGPPPPAWAHPQLQQPWQQNPWQQNPWQQNPWQQNPWQQGQTWYQPARRTSGLAVAALVTGIFALVPIAVGLAIAALVRIRRSGEAGTGLAIGGIVAAGVWTLVVALVALVGFSGVFGFSREGDLADVASKEVGACLLEDTQVVTDCASPHDIEVYYAAPLPPGPWPGESGVDADADDICYDAFEGYVGISYDDSEYDYTFFAPSRSEWLAGQRTVVCVVTPSGRHLVGSVKDSAR